LNLKRILSAEMAFQIGDDVIDCLFLRVVHLGFTVRSAEGEDVSV
jgi:3-deoxy-D-manno-octulosonate 8-phosphate phosphatase KdsC-like HAD superfamily phosphatase